MLVPWLAAPSHAGFVDRTPPALAIDGVKDGGAVFFDLDQDGALDLLAAGAVDLDGPHLLVADGFLKWKDATASQAPDLAGLTDATRGLLAADLTNDGYPDLVRVGRWEIDVLVNSGPPGFSLTLQQAIPYPAGTQGFEGGGVLDANGDGWLDVLVTAASLGNDLLVNPADGTAWFAVIDQDPLGMTAYSNSDYAALADWDFDGDVDVVIRGQGAGDDAFLNLGGSWKADPGVDLDGNDSAKGAVSLCDRRGVGALDLYWSSPLDPEVSGFEWTGTWSPLDLEPAFWPTGANSVDCVDLDDDGIRDLWMSDDDDEDVFYGPDFTYEAVGNDFTPTVASTFADVDGDGDQDVFLTNDGAPDQLLLNTVDDQRTLLVALRANVGTCAAPITRDDFGAWARVVEPTPGSLAELSGGSGRGQLATPWLHFGLDPAEAHRLLVGPRFGGEAPFLLEVPAGVRTLTIRTDDPDGDGMTTAVERAAAGGGDHDTDGDGLLDWADTDADGDGRLDADERGTGDPCAPPLDSNADGLPDFLDPTDPTDPTLPTDSDPGGTATGPQDADGDGVADAVDPYPEDPGGALESPPSPPPGCGCESASSPGWFALAVALMGVRRRSARSAPARMPTGARSSALAERPAGSRSRGSGPPLARRSTPPR